MDNHARVVQLELNHATLEPFAFRQVLGKLGGQFAVYEELEIVALGNDVDIVPVTFPDIILGQAIFNWGNSWFVVLPYDEPIATEAAMLPASGRMEIPCTHYILANAEMADISVVTLEMALARLVRDCPNAHAAIALTGKTVGKLKLQIGDLLVRAVRQVASALVTIADNHSVFYGPGSRCLCRHSLPAFQGLAIEDGDETIGE